jgi:hypothetical protein
MEVKKVKATTILKQQMTEVKYINLIRAEE